MTLRAPYFFFFFFLRVAVLCISRLRVPRDTARSRDWLTSGTEERCYVANSWPSLSVFRLKDKSKKKNTSESRALAATEEEREGEKGQGARTAEKSGF